MTGAVPARSLREVMALEAAGADRFVEVVPAPMPSPRLFGGFVAGQCVRAAALTVEDARRPHSFHAYFVRAGETGRRVELTVDRVRTGRSFATRRVTATQGDSLIAVADVSFQALEDGEEVQVASPTDVAPPGEVPGRHRLTGGMWSEVFDVLPAKAPPDGLPIAMHPCWVRLRVPLGDDPVLQACAQVVIADMGMLGSSRNWSRDRDYTGSSLDHAVWMHRLVGTDGWLLLSSSAVSYFGGRGLVHGHIHDQAGTLLASMSQEGLMRGTGAVVAGAGR